MVLCARLSRRAGAIGSGIIALNMTLTTEMVLSYLEAAQWMPLFVSG